MLLACVQQSNTANLLFINTHLAPPSSSNQIQFTFTS